MTIVYTNDMIVKENYTVEEVSKKLRVSQRTILREISRGKLKFKKVGRKYLISNYELKSYLNKSEDLEKAIDRYLRENRVEMINLLQKMVSLPSVGYKKDQELQLAKFIEDRMQELGIRSTIMREGDAIAVRGSYGYSEEGILINCPLDTAPIGDINQWKYPPFGGVIKAGKIYGRGTADCKAGIVSAIYTLLALKKAIDEENIRLELVFDGAEQDGTYLGMKMVIKRGLYVNNAIIGYANDENKLVVGCRGYHRYTFQTKGKSTHTGARYNKGINAIEKMVSFINKMYLEKLPKSKSKYFPFGQRMTFSIINGGYEINVVPDVCIAKLDFRTTPDYSREFVEGLIKRVISEIKIQDKDFKIDWHYDVGNEGYVIDDSCAIVKSITKSIEKVQGKKTRIVAAGPSSVGSILFMEKIPTVIWGPKGGNVHSYDEYVEIDSIPKTAQVYAQCVLNYFKIS